MSKKEQQQEEIDLLQNIIMDKMKIVESEPNFVILLDIRTEVEQPKINFNLTITLNDNYPDSEPSFELVEKNNFLPSSKVNELKTKLKELCFEYINMPVLYQMYECILSFCDEEENKLMNEENKLKEKEEMEKKQLEMKKKEEEERLIRERTYTPVTKELFDEWYKNFRKSKNEDKKKNNALFSKLTGREFFLNKNLKIDDKEIENAQKDLEEEEEINKNDENNNIEYNPDLYKDDLEDIENIDFGKDDIDIDDK